MRGSGASEAIDSYHGVSADLDLTTLSQPMHGKGDWGVDVNYCARKSQGLMKYFTEPEGLQPEGA